MRTTSHEQAHHHSSCDGGCPPSPVRKIKLDDLLTPSQIKELLAFVNQPRNEPKPSTRNIIATWVERNHSVREAFVRHGVLKPYGCFLIQHTLGLQ